ncbi:rho GTPase-activating protein 17 isoform X4 [Ornithorhynchus anatinus]|uniref:rho GTPase-activating protein 17 isoform X4 n=1 Tax=Ornithorhynchus anatinus TaxID=9258 RepID=UPI0019D45395|nr:rho GTPase-activating protein 17 isoform X4 [Ornithorhynchus anatinus]
MKKQFNRMKQLANQTVGRAEKTEVLNDDLLQIERRLDTVRSVCHNSYKRLMGCFQGQQGTDSEKRHKKLPQTALAQNMQEASGQLEDSLLGKMLETCGDTENKLALELSLHEVLVEKDIMDPLNTLAEVDIPNIQKQRKQLSKLVLDWDSVRARWNQAHKSSGTNFQGLPSKIDSLKEEMDEAANKVEQCKDQLAADMYNFVAKEGEYARYFVMLLEAQADYHRKALAVLEKALPEIQGHQDKWAEKPAFGTPLEEHLKRSSREIALPIEACVMLLLETGMREEGLFRIGAGASKLKKLKAALDCSTSQLDEFYSDPHAVAGALKSYLRELPEPLMTFNLYEEWTQVASVQDQDKKLQDLWRTCQKLPKQNLTNFRYLIKFLAKLAQTSDVNKMTPSNIAIVLGPNLLWAKNEGTLAEMAAATSVHVVAVIEPIIQHAAWFFPEELDFNVSGAFVLPPTNSNHLAHAGSDYDSGTLERKRPASMAIMEGDLLKKEGPPKPKEAAAATTPPPLRNGGQVTTGQNPPQPTGGPNQLSVGSALNSAGPSPHTVRRAVKKPAPAPPKPANPPPGQPGNHGSSAASHQPPAISPKPATRSPSPPSQHATQGSGQTSAASQISAPRRYSSSLSPIQAPNHPPPQPPTQATPPLQTKLNSQAPSHPVAPTSKHSPEQPSCTPPQTPTPPGTPPLGKHNPSFQAPPQPQVASNPETSHPQHSPPHTGTLPRPKPVPKPRNRPSVPPPPHPPGSHSAGDGGVANPTQTSSKIVTDSNSSVPEQLPSLFPELPLESASKELHSHLVLDIDNDTESTAL